MSNGFKFEYDKNGFNELRKSPEMQALLLAKANEVKNRAGSEGFQVVTNVNPTRAVALVVAETDEAYNECLHHDVLTKALAGGME